MPNPLTSLAANMRHDVDEILAAPVLTGDRSPLETLSAALRIQQAAAELVAAAISDARDEGCTWSQIGDVLGVSRQAAFQRFGRPTDPRTGEPMSTTPLPGADDLARGVIDDLSHARWGAVVARFDTTMADRLDADGLAAAWATIIARAGTFESTGTTTSTRRADFTVTDTPLAFEAGDFTARISFRDDARIAGLFILSEEEK